MPDKEPKNKNLTWISASLGCITAGIALAWAGAQGGQEIGSVPIFPILIALAFIVNWIVFIPSYLNHTEKYFDLTGSLTYITVTIVALVLSSELDARAVLSGILVIIWAGRLGSFLFKRIKKDGHDGRFDRMKNDFWEFFMTWTIQGLWVSLTAAAALITITSAERSTLSFIGILGLVIWALGFVIEVTADKQKSSFKKDPANKDQFINEGLWSWSRHPNYFGEITLWTGMAIISIPLLSDWRWVALISPVFVFILLTRVSGIPIQKKRALKKWGGNKEFMEYMEQTPALLPLPPKRNK